MLCCFHLYSCSILLAVLNSSITAQVPLKCLFSLTSLSMLLDSISVGQWRADRADSSQIHGSPEGCSARLVPVHGRWRDMAERRLSQTGSKVRRSNSGSPGRVSAGAPKLTGAHTFFQHTKNTQLFT